MGKEYEDKIQKQRSQQRPGPDLEGTMRGALKMLKEAEKQLARVEKLTATRAAIDFAHASVGKRKLTGRTVKKIGADLGKMTASMKKAHESILKARSKIDGYVQRKGIELRALKQQVKLLPPSDQKMFAGKLQKAQSAYDKAVEDKNTYSRNDEKTSNRYKKAYEHSTTMDSKFQKVRKVDSGKGQKAEVELEERPTISPRR